MSSKKATILITDDEKSIRNSLREILEYEKYEVLEAESGREALDILAEKGVDLVLMDIKMKGMDGLETLEAITENGSDVPVVMISGHGTIQVAVDATKKGAYDFIEKPPDLNRLLITIRNALSSSQLVSENRRMRSELHKVDRMIGESRELKKIKATIDKVAKSQSRVLITGENGTGKELVARWIHEKSLRSGKQFIAVNCAAIPSELLESELFGHEKGAFTGAEQQRTGKFEQANNGTLFLDEIGDMSPEAQAKVLRALQENEIIRVGGNDRISVDVRVLAATNKALVEEIEQKQFRADLFHRINVIPIHVPPLRERREDIPLLAVTYLEKLSEEEILFVGKTFSEEALDELKKLKWPGNIRELQNVVERLALLTPGSVISRGDVDQYVSPGPAEENGLENIINKYESFHEYKEQAERLFLVQKLKENEWNISQTAETIKIQRSHMYNKMKKYDIDQYYERTTDRG